MVSIPLQSQLCFCTTVASSELEFQPHYKQQSLKYNNYILNAYILTVFFSLHSFSNSQHILNILTYCLALLPVKLVFRYDYFYKNCLSQFYFSSPKVRFLPCIRYFKISKMI